MTEERSMIALVTGAGRGLGFEVCRQLARRGMTVMATTRDPDAGPRVLDALGREGAVVWRHLDVTKPETIVAAAEAIDAQWGGLDVLINNAGVSLDGFNSEVADQTLEVNFFGAMRMTSVFLPVMKKHGRVVMVSSGLGELSAFAEPLQKKLEHRALTIEGLCALMRAFLDDVREGRHADRGWPTSAYRVSKAGLNALTRILARDPRWMELHINAVCPGWVRTEMGGPGAARSIEEGADSIVWAAELPVDGPSGALLRDRKQVEW